MAKIQQSFVKLQKLLQVEPYKIVGLWSNGETRLNDFSDEIEKWKNGSNRELKKLANPKIFSTAFIKDGTLAFAGSTIRIPGISEDQPVDFDRRTLYSDSELIGQAVNPEDALQRNQRQSTRRRRQRSPEAKAKIIDYIIKTIGKNAKPLVINIGDQFVKVQ